jgi:hypothetical protein
MTTPLTPVIVPATTYADYTFYSATQGLTGYGGTAIAAAAFPGLSLQATRWIDRLTYQRALPIITANTDTNAILAIKYACCAIAEELQNQGYLNGEDNVQSESQGEYSVTYGKTAQNSKSNQTKLIRAAKIWLDGTSLLFPGFNSGEYGSGWDYGLP